MKLTGAGKITLFVVLAVIAFFVVRQYLSAPEPDNTSEVFGNAVKTENGNSKDAPDEKIAVRTSNADSRSFNFTPDKPENGKLRGVVELGAAGFNSFVVNLDKQKRWEIVSKDFGESLAYEGLATTDDIRAGLKRYLTGMFDKGVGKNDMHFVISSGAQKEPKTAVISNELKTFGYVVNLVNAENEGKLAYNATVPPAYQDKAFLVDIGSGTTKISWKEGDHITSMEMPGAKYFEKGMTDEDIYAQVKTKASKAPEGKRNTCFILGGVPFTMAKQNRNGNERFTILNTPDTYNGSDKKTAAGLNIYKAIIDATNCKTFVFDWDSNFTIGFLLSLK